MAPSARSTPADRAGTERIPDSLGALRVPIDTLHEYPTNPRRGNEPAIRESLEVNGQYRPIVVRQATREVLAGNHTLRAARALGWHEIAATFVDANDEQAKRIVLIDNRANDLASYDDQALADLIQFLPTLDGIGYDDHALDQLLAELPSGFTPDDGITRLDRTTEHECPQCGFRYREKAMGVEPA